MWVFNYYYNPQTVETSDTWAYIYSKAPLLSEIYELLDKERQNVSFISGIVSSLSKYQIDMGKYFKPEEHLLYTCPREVLLDIAPGKYRKFIKRSEYYINLDNKVDIIFNKGKNNEIDCRGVIFITKCTLKTEEKYTISEFISEVRKEDKIGKN